jgi:tetratricopeptide (TPR) repeat protein
MLLLKSIEAHLKDWPENDLMEGTMRLILLISVIMVLIVPSALFAETKEIISEGTYNMGDGETPSVAESRALLRAKQIALEQAGTYVESYSKVKNITLTHDEIQVLASGLMEVEIIDKKRTIVGDGINFWVKIKAKVSPDKMEEMAKRVRERSIVDEYNIMQEKYAESQKEIEKLKNELVQAKDEKKKKTISAKISKEEIQFQAGEWYSKGYKHYLNNEFDDAILAFTVAIKLNPHDVIAYHDRAEAYSQMRLYDMAIADYGRSITEATSADESSLEMGRQWPLPFYKKIFVSNYNDRAVAYIQKGQYEHAKEDLDKAITIDPGSAMAIFNRGNVEHKANSYDNAIEYYNKAIDLGLRDIRVYKQRGSAYLLKGQFDKAIEDYSKVISNNPDEPMYILRGSAYRQVTQYDKAIDDFSLAIKLNPSNAFSYLDRGRVYYAKSLGDAIENHVTLDKALADYNSALSLNAKLSEGYRERGIIYALSDSDKAIEDFTKAISLEPDSFLYCLRGKMYENGGRYDKALDDYNRAIQSNPKQAEGYGSRGELYLKIRKFENAYADFDRACKLGNEYSCNRLQINSGK